MSNGADIEFLKARANKLQRAMIAKGWSRKMLAAEAHCDEKTLRNVFAGETVRDQTILTLAKVLGIEIDLEPLSGTIGLADEQYGGYGRSVNSIYEGRYALYRRTFSITGGVYRSPVQIAWNSTARHLMFHENFQDSNHAEGTRLHSGSVYISAQTNLVHFVTAVDGSVRMMTLTRLNVLDGTMRGCLLTQRETALFYMPTVSPVFMRKLKSTDSISTVSETVRPDTDEFIFASGELQKTVEHIVSQQF